MLWGLGTGTVAVTAFVLVLMNATRFSPKMAARTVRPSGVRASPWGAFPTWIVALTASVHVGNAPSMRAFARVGFLPDGADGEFRKFRRAAC